MSTFAEGFKEGIGKNFKFDMGSFGKAIGSNIGGIGTAAGGLIGSAIGGGYSSGAGNTLNSLGDIGGMIPGPFGAAIGGGLKILGGVANAAFGTKVNQAALNAANEGTSYLKNFTSNASSFDDIQGPKSVGGIGQVYKGGWFSKSKARKKNDELKRKRALAADYANRSVENNVDNIADTQLDILQSSYFALGGPLYTRYRRPLFPPIFSDGGDPSRPNYAAYGGGLNFGTGAIGYDFTNQYLNSKNNTSLGLNNNLVSMPNSFQGLDIFAFGGELNTQGADFTNGLLHINNGGSHESNPYEGVPMGADAEGTPNLVEEGETVFNDYVFSNRIAVPKAIRDKYKLRGTKKLTFAEASKKLVKESEERPNDPISKRGLEASMNELMIAQEMIREKKNKNKIINFFDGGGYLSDDPDFWGLDEEIERRRAKQRGPRTRLDPTGSGETIPSNNNKPKEEAPNKPRTYIPDKSTDPRSRVNPEGASTVEEARERKRKNDSKGTPSDTNKETTDSSSSTKKETHTKSNGNKKNHLDQYNNGYKLPQEQEEEIILSARREHDRRTLPSKEALDFNDYLNKHDLNIPRDLTITEIVSSPEYYNFLNEKYGNNTSVRSNTGNGTGDNTSVFISPTEGVDLTDPYGVLLAGADKGLGLSSKEEVAKKRQQEKEFKQRVDKKVQSVNHFSEKYEDPKLKIKESYDTRDTSLRYAPAIGLGLMTLTDALGITNNPNYGNADAMLELGRMASQSPTAVRFKPIGDYLTYRPLDRNYYLNQLNASNAATRRNIMNTSGGNRGKAMAGILAADYSAGIQAGALARQAEEYNLEQIQKVADFNRATNMANSEGFMKAAMAIQDAEMRARSLGLDAQMAGYKMREATRLAAEEDRAANLSGFINTLGNIGRDNAILNQRDFAIATGNPIGKDLLGLVKFKKGGYLKRKKRGLTY